MFLFLLGKYPEVEFLDHIVVLSLIFCGTFILLSIVVVAFTFPQWCTEVPFSPILADVSCFLSFLYKSYSDKCEMISHCSFDLHFSVD